MCDADINWTIVPDLEYFGERLNDEDHRDENCKALLCEPGYILHQGAQVECNDEQNYENNPSSNPKPEGHEIQVVVSAQTSSQSGVVDLLQTPFLLTLRHCKLFCTYV
jgi:hypothetical protein